MSASIADMTSPEVQQRLSRFPVAVLPFGSVEQHGPHLPCGTDTMAAEMVARRLAEGLGALYVPFAPYGVTPLHAGRPGTITLTRETFESLSAEVCEGLVEMGGRVLVFVNWHEVNTPSLDAVGMRIQGEGRARCYVAQACYVAQELYRDRGGTLTHGGGIETLAVMAHDPALIKLERAGEGTRPPGAGEADEMRRGTDVYGFVTDVAEIAEEGWYGDPGWATQELAEGFAAQVAGRIEARLKAIGAFDGERR